MLATQLAAIALVLAQAGGGGSFGSGSGGGGGGGDGDGIGWILYLLIRLAIEVPIVGVPLLIAVVVVAIVGARKGWWRHQERVIRRARPAREARAAAAAADVLRASDPAFDEARFLARVRTAFDKAQSSWCAQDLETLRPFVSDGVFERFSLQIEEQRQDGWRQGMQGLSVGAPRLLHVEPGRHFEAVTVRIPFRCDIHRLDLKTGKRVPGSKLPREHFVECWTFLRRRGARSVEGDGLIEGRCPNCGAPIRINQSARCGHCECLARSGEFDWVLTEITQESEWRAEREAAIPGLQAFASRDPGVSVAMLEDRASVAFWRWSAAERAADVDPLRRVADEALCEQVAGRLAAAGKERTYDADRAVGSVRTLGLLGGEQQDRALVELVWDGRRAEVDAKGRRELAEGRRLRRTLFVLARKAGAETRLTEAFTTTHCQSCGAHDLGGTSSSCAYCEAPRTGDAATWLVTAIEPTDSLDAQDLLGELTALRYGAPAPKPAAVTPPVPAAARAIRTGSPMELVTWAAAMAHADGTLVGREEKGLRSLAARLDLPEERVEQLIATPPEDGAAPTPRDPDEARAWLGELAELALADGHIDATEMRLLRRATERSSLQRRDLQRAVGDARVRLFRASRQA